MNTIWDLTLPCAAALGLVLFIAAAACSNGDAGDQELSEEAKRVFILHSYDNQFPWTVDQGEGIVQGLTEAGLVGGASDPRVFYMETRLKYTTEEQIQARAEEALRMIDEFRPHIVFTTDDAALQYVAVPWSQRSVPVDLPFVFSGVNADPTIYPPIHSLEHPGGPITGALERLPFAEAFQDMRRVFPAARKIALLAHDSASSAEVIEDFYRRYPSNDGLALEVISFEQITAYDQWKQKIVALQGEVDLIGLLNYHMIENAQGTVVPPAEVADWTIRNSPRPVVGLVTDWVTDGLVMTAGNSGSKTGVYVAKMGVEILDGRRPGDMAIADPGVTEVAFNLVTAKAKGIEIPPAELAQAADVVR